MNKGRLEIDEERCKGCGLCVEACPHHLLALDPAHFNHQGYHPARLHDPTGVCSGCALCAVVCPDIAIEVLRRQAPPKGAK
jgi:2-oxoglutarate ferredoxin oxidoreductase subunit delta